MKTLRTAVLTAAVLAVAGLSHAGELGHFNPGIPNIRDFVVPPPGWYVVAYNYYYTTDRLNDAGGNEVDSVTIDPGPGLGVTLDLDVDLVLYALSPMIIWVTPWKLAGARYAVYIAPGFVTSTLGTALNATTGRGLSGVIELRTAPQGHPAYRRICQAMHRLIADQAGHRAIAAAMPHVDLSEGEAGRRAAEQAAENRRLSRR